MALNASVVGLDIFHARGIQNISARGMLGVLASWTVAALAAHAPFDDLLGMGVVVYGMAAIAGRAPRPPPVVARIDPPPPIISACSNIPPPTPFAPAPPRAPLPL